MVPRSGIELTTSRLHSFIVAKVSHTLFNHSAMALHRGVLTGVCVLPPGVEIVHQLAEQHALPLTTAYSCLRGFHMQLRASSRQTLPDSLPAEFLKVTRSGATITCSSADMVRSRSFVRYDITRLTLLDRKSSMSLVRRLPGSQHFALENARMLHARTHLHLDILLCPVSHFPLPLSLLPHPRLPPKPGNIT